MKKFRMSNLTISAIVLVSLLVGGFCGFGIAHYHNTDKMAQAQQIEISKNDLSQMTVDLMKYKATHFDWHYNFSSPDLVIMKIEGQEYWIHASQDNLSIYAGGDNISDTNLDGILDSACYISRSSVCELRLDRHVAVDLLWRSKYESHIKKIQQALKS